MFKRDVPGKLFFNWAESILGLEQAARVVVDADIIVAFKST